MAITFPASVGLASTTAATQFTLTIPSGTLTDDILILAITQVNSVGDPIVTDNDTGGNAWAKITSGNNGTSHASVYWKRATSATASKTVTVDDNASDASTSICGALLVCRGVSRAATPYTNESYETNASGNETHAGFTPGHDQAAIFLCVFNATNDIDPDTFNSTNPGALTAGSIYGESTAGTDCSVEIGAGVQTAAAATGNLTWAQVDAASMSIAFALQVFAEITPTTGAVALTGAAPALDSGLIPTTGALTLTGFAPTLEASNPSPTLTPPAGALSVTGAAVSLQVNLPITPPPGTMAMAGGWYGPPAGFWTGLTQDFGVITQAGALALAGAAGRLDAGVVTAAGSLALTGSAPAVVQGILRTPEAGALSVTGAAPAVVIGTLITVPAGSLTLTGHAPTLEEGSVGNTNRTPDAAALQLTGQAPAVAWTVTPGVGAAALTGHAPTVKVGTLITADAASLTLTGQAPALLANTFITPPAGALALTGQAGTTRVDARLTPPAGTLTATGSAPALLTGTFLSPGVGALTATGHAPEIAPVLQPGSTALAVTGWAPEVESSAQPDTPPAPSVRPVRGTGWPAIEPSPWPPIRSRRPVEVT